ncbi:cation transporter [uncultured Rubinisphaera sp.]|uniref:cation diffusion facilitator family transporter n=1 Tax=uncultured Rubinisphaera sp. TaxID=1678686 RepID=UPI0030DD50A9
MQLGNTDWNHFRRYALALSIFTVVYNLAEAAIAITASNSSNSLTLFGFGLDSLLESLSGGIMIWRFWKDRSSNDSTGFEIIEQRATRMVACTFLLLGAYVLIDAGLALYWRHQPEESWVGIILAIASLIVMPILFMLKYRLGKQMQSPSLVADSKETLACILLSGTMLIGLGTYELWKIWWIDSVVAIVIAGFLLHEGYEMLEGECGSSECL